MTDTQLLRGIATVSFWAADLEAAKKWYTELLGLAPTLNAQTLMYNPHYLEILEATRKA